MLVRPKINGREEGFMVVDTGASGFVISPEAAAQMRLDTFGELFAASISGKVRPGRRTGWREARPEYLLGQEDPRNDTLPQSIRGDLDPLF